MAARRAPPLDSCADRAASALEKGNPMRIKELAVLPVLLLALAAACKSSSNGAAEIACTCGDPATDFAGCAHPSCIAGHTNPDNPDCVCGTMSIPK